MLRGSVAHTALHRFYAGLPKELGTERVDRGERSTTALALPRRVPRRRARSGVRIELTRARAARARARACGATSSGSSATRRGRQLAARAAALRGRLRLRALGAGAAARPRPRRRDLRSAGKIDRIDVDPFSARGIVQDYKSGKGAHSARADRRRSCGCRSRSTCSSCATSSGSSRSAASTARSRATRGARGMLRAEARDDGCPASRERLPRRGRVLGAGRDGAREPARAARAADPRRRRARTTRRAATARRGATSGRCAG